MNTKQYYANGGRIVAYVGNNEVVIEYDDNDDTFSIQSWDDDGYLVDRDWFDTYEECELEIPEFVALLQEYDS